MTEPRDLDDIPVLVSAAKFDKGWRVLTLRKGHHLAEMSGSYLTDKAAVREYINDWLSARNLTRDDMELVRDVVIFSLTDHRKRQLPAVEPKHRPGCMLRDARRHQTYH